MAPGRGKKHTKPRSGAFVLGRFNRRRAEKALVESKRTQYIRSQIKDEVGGRWRVLARKRPKDNLQSVTFATKEGITYSELLDILQRLRRDAKLRRMMRGSPDTYISIEVEDPRRALVGKWGGHSLSRAANWEVAIAQAVENRKTGAKDLATHYKQSTVYAITIYQYQTRSHNDKN